MSFTIEVKNEMAHISPSGRHCAIAELAGLINGAAVFDNKNIVFKTELKEVAVKYYYAIKNVFNADMSVCVRSNRKNQRKYILKFNHLSDSVKIAETIGVYSNNKYKRHISSIVTGKQCCKRAYVRGAFLAAGNISSPKNAYHLEVNIRTLENANELCRMLEFFELSPKALKRDSSSSYALYLKDSEQIACFLNVAGAVNSFLNYENTRILKSVINDVNRLCNCDTANIDKTISAANKQIEAINIIDDKIGISNLPQTIKEAAILRKTNPELNLTDLGGLFNPPLSKSGVNHRLRKIIQIAEVEQFNYNTNSVFNTK